MVIVLFVRFSGHGVYLIISFCVIQFKPVLKQKKNSYCEEVYTCGLVHQCREGMLLSTQALLPQTAECLPGGVVGLHLHPRPI